MAYNLVVSFGVFMAFHLSDRKSITSQNKLNNLFLPKNTFFVLNIYSKFVWNNALAAVWLSL